MRWIELVGLPGVGKTAVVTALARADAAVVDAATLAARRGTTRGSQPRGSTPARSEGPLRDAGRAIGANPAFVETLAAHRRGIPVTTVDATRPLDALVVAVREKVEAVGELPPERPDARG